MTEQEKARALTMKKVDVKSDLAPLVELMAQMVQQMQIALTAHRVAVRDQNGNLIGSRVQQVLVALTGLKQPLLS